MRFWCNTNTGMTVVGLWGLGYFWPWPICICIGTPKKKKKLMFTLPSSGGGGWQVNTIDFLFSAVCEGQFCNIQNCNFQPAEFLILSLWELFNYDLPYILYV